MSVTSRRPLRATYRLQLTPDFGFAAAGRLVPYLRDLGVSHLYLSPSLQARHGSTHGYDVIDPTRLSEDLGGEPAFRALVRDAHAAGLGIVLDIVPNHMATDEHNRFWSDPELRRRFFDVDETTGRWRRFFDIDELAGVRQEDPSVFEETHRLVLGLVREGLVDALRIDHPDGLADPLQYFERLRDGGASVVWIEKILESGESLRDWPVAGTVGYEFLNDVCEVFVDPAAESAFDALWVELSGDARPFAEVALEAKRKQASTTFRPELERLARTLSPTGGLGAPRAPSTASTALDPPPRASSTISIELLGAAVAAFPVYRSYIRPGEPISDEDRAVVGEAELPAEVAELLLGERDASAEFVVRFQQTTPPVVAKGIEDTAFYRYGRLLSLCEVGGDPGRFGISVERLHAANVERARRFPLAMLTTMTHDTKRSADVRARITALTWLADEWPERVRSWMSLTDELRSVDGAPDGLERYFLFQTLVGAWPIERERVAGYMEKALREAKRNTNWIEQNESWERGVRTFVEALYEHEPFLRDFEPFVARLARLGDRVALGTLALKLTSPGVPDLYQGDELPLRALVDPDNRRPVDWDWHEAMLRRVMGGSPPDRDTMKLRLCAQLLGLRIRRPDSFGPDGAYSPVDAGPGVVCFTRGEGREQVLVAVAVRREVGGTLGPIGGSWRDVLSGDGVSLVEPVRLADLLGADGIAVLDRG
ncbi:MAG TPA: malto-oligosyltrehalose synthase [Solirubrobacteraceae bacterium]|nr:malto-oligosyltrehalose synthase [Solirubrobacteraceae bacterium]